MSPLTREEGAEDQVLSARRRDVVVTATVLALTAVAFAAVADHGIMAHLQRADDAWLRLMISGRAAPVTAVAKVFNWTFVFRPYFDVFPNYEQVRVTTGWLRAASGAKVIADERIETDTERLWDHYQAKTLKAVYDRARPPGSLVATSGASFPSGHAIAASVTVVAAVLALVPPGRRRVAYGLAAGAFSVLMALSRAYLGAHWLSDALAGVLLGTSCALLAAFAVGELQGRRTAHRAARSARPPVAGTARPADRR